MNKQLLTKEDMNIVNKLLEDFRSGGGSVVAPLGGGGDILENDLPEGIAIGMDGYEILVDPVNRSVMGILIEDQNTWEKVWVSV